jgi:hypothetical protein
MLVLTGCNRVLQVCINGDKSRTFALKALKKKHIVDTRQQEHIFAERNIMMETRSEWIVRYVSISRMIIVPLQIVFDISRCEVRVHALGGESRGRVVDDVAGSRAFRRLHGEILRRLCLGYCRARASLMREHCRRIGVSASEEHRVSRFETGELSAHFDRLSQTGPRPSSLPFKIHLVCRLTSVSRRSSRVVARHGPSVARRNTSPRRSSSTRVTIRRRTIGRWASTSAS